MFYPRTIKFRAPQPSRQVTREQIIDLLFFLRDVYPSLTHKKLTAARLYAVVKLLTETGTRAGEVLQLDAVRDDTDTLFSKKGIQTRFGKGHNLFGSQMRAILLSHRFEIAVREYKRVVRPQFRNKINGPSLFLTLNASRLSYRTLRSDFARLIEAARKHGVTLPPTLTIHDLRRSFLASYL
jgi:site-specific recombinase XerD